MSTHRQDVIPTSPAPKPEGEPLMNFQNVSAAALSDAVTGTGARPAATAISNPDRLAHESIDAVASGVQRVRANAGPALHELAVGAEDLARSGAHAARQQAARVRDASSDYVREHPLQSMLLAFGTGAALALLARLLTSPRSRVR
jgi:ElaB/YqjD/DUF883 family membrane-anchored ribosome-binding protein